MSKSPVGQMENKYSSSFTNIFVIVIIIIVIVIIIIVIIFVLLLIFTHLYTIQNDMSIYKNQDVSWVKAINSLKIS